VQPDAPQVLPGRYAQVAPKEATKVSGRNPTRLRQLLQAQRFIAASVEELQGILKRGRQAAIFRQQAIGQVLG
jgi:hypothetical protein